MAPGTRKKFGAPIFEPEVFGKQMYCFEKVLVALWVLAPAVIRRPENIPHDLSLRFWCYAIKIGYVQKINKFSYPNVMNFYSINICTFWNTIRHGFCTDCQQRLFAAIQVSSCSFCVTSMPVPRVVLAWTCVCFAKNKTFPTFNKLLF